MLLPLRAVVPVPEGHGEPDQSWLSPLEPVGSLRNETQNPCICPLIPFSLSAALINYCVKCLSGSRSNVKDLVNGCLCSTTDGTKI